MGLSWALCLSVWLKHTFAVLENEARASWVIGTEVIDTEKRRHLRHGESTSKCTCNRSSLGLYNTKSSKLSWPSCCCLIRKRLGLSYWGHIWSFIFAGMCLNMYQIPHKYCLQISQWNVGHDTEYLHENTKSAKPETHYKMNSKHCNMFYDGQILGQ